MLTSSTTAWTSGNVYTLGDENVKIESRITVNGTVFLLLPDGKTLNAQNGITVASGNTLVIDKYGTTSTGTGILNATGPDDSAGIGGVLEYGKKDAGTVIINGGKVTATGGEDAAGIGGGEGGNGGTVIINGGTVDAQGGGYAAGIGGGVTGVGGTVTITGGTVTANGGDFAAGIGGGWSGDGGTVIINGGAVTATGGEGATGIGRGDEGDSDGTLKIGYGVLVYKTGETEDYDYGPRDNVSTRYRNMTVIKP